MTKNKEMYSTWGEKIKRNGTLLNIEFKTKVDARLCCKLLNQQENDISYYINHLDEIFTWHKEHYGKTILDEKLEFKSDCEKENELLKKENDQLKATLRTYRKVANCRNCDYHDYDCREDGDDFEICEKGNDVTEGICEEWREL